MTSKNEYGIEFSVSAKKEWDKLSGDIKKQFKKKLEKLRFDPYAAPRLKGDLHGLFKVKLRSSGFRMIYQVIDDEIVILILGVGKRNNDDIYTSMKTRI